MLSRPDLARLVDRLFDRLDELEGDTDAEDDDPTEDDHDAEEADEAL